MQDSLDFGDARARYADSVYDGIENRALLRLVPQEARRVIDLGCGAGSNARALSEAGHEVYGVTASSREAELARRYCRRVVVCDVECTLPEFGTRAELLLCSHVLEHLREPAAVLTRLSDLLEPAGLCAIAVPNMAHWRLRARFLAGDWTRDGAGALDRTHLQFWSYDSAPSLLQSTPFELLRHEGEFSVPLWPLRRLAPGLAGTLDLHLGPRRPNLFAGQTLMLLRKRA
jgi:SAM-dependent methyltransferase